MMLLERLDQIIPYLAFVYGALMTFVLFHPKFISLAENRLSGEVYNWWMAKRPLALFCLVVGTFWSIQNIWV